MAPSLYIRPFLALGALFAAGAAQAGEQCHEALASLQPTDWKLALELPRFDPALGTLTGVRLELDGFLEGSIGLENLDPLPARLESTLGAMVSVEKPGGGLLLLTDALAGFSDDLAGFDGVIDFHGRSGVTHGRVMASETDVLLLGPGDADLALFIGPSGAPGTVALDVRALGHSFVSGSGNLVALFSSQAAAALRVCYTYEVGGGGGTQGCTPGFWRNHLPQWAATGYAPVDSWVSVFGVDPFPPSLTLLDAVRQGGGGWKRLGRHATAALLNAASPHVDYPFAVGEVLAIVQQAWTSGDVNAAADVLEAANELGCPDPL